MFAASEALAAGVSRDEITRLVRTRQWVRLRHGVYVDRATFDSMSGQAQRHRLFVQGHLLKLGPGAVASHRSAALLSGMSLLEGPSDVEVTRTTSTTRVRAGLRVLDAPLPAHHVATDAQGVAITAPARTVVDLARYLPFREAVVAADSALHQRLVAPGELATALEFVRFWRGSLRAGRVVAAADGRADSPGESLLRLDLHALGWLEAVAQAEVHGASGARYFADFLLPSVHVIIEFDGRIKYLDSPHAVFDAEKRREDDLRQMGWAFVRITWADLGRLDVLREKIRAAVAVAHLRRAD
ncbi:transcriptional regulator with AbiEi antitoxin domain of type IV toxin-antitoxin system [Motilibacter peucedani]|uniref:Transcriptional regulator with AbiEi antitoxin domain of type IV toxin-antitoxin system n=1 Tax=Motilibacter peucedani TaxID=598650 RepID=A0A420XJL1_9ACTN|nr:transcriptional regulator with AbiEi antitoxin domain of type IV toxin-antitoxin system [Motilibacter peucedani]